MIFFFKLLQAHCKKLYSPTMDCWSSLFSYENGKLIKHRNKTDYEIDAANSHYTEAR